MTTTAAPTATATVDALIAAIGRGEGGTVAPLYGPDAVLDATVPGWRFSLRGGAAIAAQLASWFRDAARFEELDRLKTSDGEVIRYLLTWEENGVPHAAHHCHVLSIDGGTGLITRDHVFCGGRWDATRLAEMAKAENAG